MKTNQKLAVLSTLSLLVATTAPSSAVVVMLSDLVPPAGFQNIENFLNTNFTNVTEIRHGDYSNFLATATQDALLGTGAYAGDGPAEVVIIGRSLASSGYQNGNADGYNALLIPVVNFTSYTARQDTDRMGWHGSGATTDQSVAGAETTVTATGALILGLAAGNHDLLTEPTASITNFNGLADGTTAFGGGSILATVGTDTLAAYWDVGDAPGNPTNAGVPTFPGKRLLFNMDNEPSTGNDGQNDLGNLTPAGIQAMVSAIDYATPLTAVPEPSLALLGLAGLGLLARRRR